MRRRKKKRAMGGEKEKGTRRKKLSISYIKSSIEGKKGMSFF